MLRDFVIDKVWGKLRSDTRMKCPLSGKPIIDLGIYTKNRTFRIPGSCKLAIPKDPACDPLVPLPSKEFFMITRMADRREIPGSIPRKVSWPAKSLFKGGSTPKKRRRATLDAHPKRTDQGRLHPLAIPRTIPETIFEKKKKIKMAPWSLRTSKSSSQRTSTSPRALRT